MQESQDYDYFEEIDNRTQYRKNIVSGKIIRNGITTAYPALDAQLYHLGWGRRELSCLMGTTKTRKKYGFRRLYLQCCVSWLQHIVYYA